MHKDPLHFKRRAIAFAILCVLSLVVSGVIAYFDLDKALSGSPSMSLLIIAIIMGFLCGTSLSDASKAKDEQDIERYRKKVREQREAQRRLIDQEPIEHPLDANHEVLAHQFEVGCSQLKAEEEERRKQHASHQAYQYSGQAEVYTSPRFEEQHTQMPEVQVSSPSKMPGCQVNSDTGNGDSSNTSGDC